MSKSKSFFFQRERDLGEYGLIGSDIVLFSFFLIGRPGEYRMADEAHGTYGTPEYIRPRASERGGNLLMPDNIIHQIDPTDVRKEVNVTSVTLSISLWP